MAYRDGSRSRVDYYRGRARHDECRRPQSARQRTPSDSSHDSCYDDDDNDRFSSRHRRPSDYDDSRSRQQESNSNSNPGSRVINKATLAVGALTIIAGMLQLWTVKKSRQQREAAKQERQQDFRKRKEERRRMEAKLDRERQARWAAERRREQEEAESEVRRSMRQIEFQPRVEGERERARLKRLPAPTGWVEGEVVDDGYGDFGEDGQRSRARPEVR